MDEVDKQHHPIKHKEGVFYSNNITYMEFTEQVVVMDTITPPYIIIPTTTGMVYYNLQ